VIARDRETEREEERERETRVRHGGRSASAHSSSRENRRALVRALLPRLDPDVLTFVPPLRTSDPSTSAHLPPSPKTAVAYTLVTGMGADGYRCIKDSAVFKCNLKSELLRLAYDHCRVNSLSAFMADSVAALYKFCT